MGSCSFDDDDYGRSLRRYLNCMVPKQKEDCASQKDTEEATTQNPATSLLYKDVSSLDKINEYNVITLWGITDPYLQDALKALLKASPQCNNDKHTGVQDVINLLELWKANA